MLRKLRIAWSMGCGILCLLMIALWVRSYWYGDSLYFPKIGGYQLEIVSMPATMTSNDLRIPNRIGVGGSYGGSLTKMLWLSAPVKANSEVSDAPTVSAFNMFYNPAGTSIITMPHWFSVLLFATTAVVPWLPWLSCRFSLRTLLILTTVVAVLLGIIAVAIR